MKAIVSQEVRWTMTARQTQGSAKQPPPYITKNHPSQKRQGDQRGRHSVQSHLTTLEPDLSRQFCFAHVWMGVSSSHQHTVLLVAQHSMGGHCRGLLKKHPKNTKDIWKIHCHSSNFFRMERKPLWVFRQLSQTNLLHEHRIPDTGDHVRKKINVWAHSATDMLDCGMVVQHFFSQLQTAQGVKETARPEDTGLKLQIWQ